MTSVDGINLAHLHQTFIDLIGISCISRYTLQTCFVWTRLVCSPKINIIIELYLFRTPFNYRTHRYTHITGKFYACIRVPSLFQLRQTSIPCHNKRFPQTMNSLLSYPSDLHSYKRERAIFRGRFSSLHDRDGELSRNCASMSFEGEHLLANKSRAEKERKIDREMER